MVDKVVKGKRYKVSDIGYAHGVMRASFNGETGIAKKALPVGSLNNVVIIFDDLSKRRTSESVGNWMFYREELEEVADE